MKILKITLAKSSFLVLILFFGCSSNKDSVNIEDRISRIENGLMLPLQIEGEPVPTYSIEERLKEYNAPGVSIAVINNGELEWAKGWGMADSSENRAITTETMFLAGSISKPVAATRAHQLMEEGVIHLDSNVNNYLTSWQVPDNEFTVNEKVTTRRILNHTAGLTVWGFPGYDKGDTIPTPVDVLNGVGNTDSILVYKEPGKSWRYSGGGYTIMQVMIEDLEGEPYHQLMQTNVLDPLGMTASTYANPLPEQYHSIAATGYRRNGDEVEGKWPIYPEMAAAGLWTTPSQLVLWAKEMQEIFQKQEDGLLKSETVNEMLTPGMDEWGLGPVSSEHRFSHGGADEGFRARLEAWKEHPVAVVIMVNSDNGSIITEIMLSIAKEYGLPGIEPEVRKFKETSAEDREPMNGIYHFVDMGDATITTKEKGLEITADFLNEPVFILPETDSTYFNRNNGNTFTFEKEDSKVIGVRVQGVYGTKKE